MSDLLNEEEMNKVNPFPKAMSFIKRIIVFIYIVLIIKYVSFLSLPALGNFSIPGIPYVAGFPRYMDGEPFLKFYTDYIIPQMGITNPDEIAQKVAEFKKLGVVMNSNPFPDSTNKKPIEYKLAFGFVGRTLFKIAQFIFRLFSFGILMITQSVRALLILIFNEDWYYKTCFLRNHTDSNESLLSYLVSIGIDKLFYNEFYPSTLLDSDIGRIDKVKRVIKPMMPIYIFAFLFSIFTSTVGFKNLVFVAIVISMVLFSVFRGVFKLYPFEGINAEIMKWKLFPGNLIKTVMGFEFSNTTQMNINKNFNIENPEQFLPKILIDGMMHPEKIPVYQSHSLLNKIEGDIHKVQEIKKELPGAIKQAKDVYEKFTKEHISKTKENIKGLQSINRSNHGWVKPVKFPT